MQRPLRPIACASFSELKPLSGIPPHGSEKLAGYADRYRIRQESYRIIYLIDDDHREVTIFKTGHRKDVYR